MQQDRHNAGYMLCLWGRYALLKRRMHACCADPSHSLVLCASDNSGEMSEQQQLISMQGSLWRLLMLLHACFPFALFLLSLCCSC